MLTRAGMGPSPPVIRGGPYQHSLREELTRVGIPYWAEITVGTSMRDFRALDLYLSIFGSSVASPEEEAEYRLNCELPPMQRSIFRPEDFWRCRHWVSAGQRPRIAEWNLEF